MQVFKRHRTRRQFVVAEAVILYRASPARRWLLLACGGLVATGAALLPLAIAQRGGTEWITTNSLPNRIADTAAQYLIGPNAPAPLVVGPIAGALVLAAAWLLLYRTSHEERRWAMLMAVVGAAGLVGPLVLAIGGLDVFLQKSMIGSLVPCEMKIRGLPRAAIGCMTPGDIAITLGNWSPKLMPKDRAYDAPSEKPPTPTRVLSIV